MRLIDDPVTTTRSIFGAAGSAAWADAMPAGSSHGPSVAATITTDGFNLKVRFDMRKYSSVSYSWNRGKSRRRWRAAQARRGKSLRERQAHIRAFLLRKGKLYLWGKAKFCYIRLTYMAIRAMNVSTIWK
jgi:hypothetical protein